jgi:anti-anti-sigma regulatory factor
MTMCCPATTEIEIVHDFTESAPAALVYLRGTIDTKCGPLLRSILGESIGGNVRMAVDLKNVESINVGGLFALHSVAIDIRTLHGGFLVLRNVNDTIRGLLKILPLNLPIEETVDREGVLSKPSGMWAVRPATFAKHNVPIHADTAGVCHSVPFTKEVPVRARDLVKPEG